MPKEEPDTRFSLVAALVVLMKCIVAAPAQPVSVTLTDVLPLPTSVMDQNAQSFTVTGASGVAYLGNDEYAVILDNSDKVVFLEITLNADGSVASLTPMGGLTLVVSADYEGIALRAPGELMVCEETTPGLDAFALATGAQTGPLAVPAVYANARDNRALESLEIQDGAGWTANEEALTGDGPLSTPGAGTTVRLLEFDPATGTPGRQLAYEVERMHGPIIPVDDQGQSGLTDLALMPGGTLLALERSFALAGSLFLTRIYQIDEAGATDVSGIAALDGAAYTPVSKTLVWTGELGNLEGLTRGPELPGGSHALVGVADDGDPFSLNQIVFFRATGGGVPCFADCDGNAILNVDDIECFVNAFLGSDLGGADCDGNAILNVDDIECFVASFLGGCP